MTELVKLAKEGDKSAFDEIIRNSAPDLFRIALSILKNKDDADDAVCDTVVKAYENISKFKGLQLIQNVDYSHTDQSGKRRIQTQKENNLSKRCPSRTKA